MQIDFGNVFVYSPNALGSVCSALSSVRCCHNVTAAARVQGGDPENSSAALKNSLKMAAAVIGPDSIRLERKNRQNVRNCREDEAARFN